MDTEILVTPDGREWQPYVPPEPPPPPPPPSFDLYRVKKWGEDAVMNFHGYTTKNLTGGNFQVVGLLVEDKTGFWGADQVGHKVKIDKDTIDKIAALQPFDSDWSLDQKMKWLMNGEKGRPYFFEKGLDWGWDDKFKDEVGQEWDEFKKKDQKTIERAAKLLAKLTFARFQGKDVDASVKHLEAALLSFGAIEAERARRVFWETADKVVGLAATFVSGIIQKNLA